MTKDEAKDIKRHFDVVAEHLDSSIHAVAEGVAVNTERIERLQGATQANTERIERLQSATQANTERIERLQGATQANTERIEGLQGATQRGFERVDSQFGHLETEMRRGFRELGDRVERLESKQTA